VRSGAHAGMSAERSALLERIKTRLPIPLAVQLMNQRMIAVDPVLINLAIAVTDASLTYRFYPDAAPNPYIEAAKRLPEVQTVLWFARFPVTRFHKEGADAIVEISDLRFPQIRPDRPASFTYRVRFAADQTVLSQGWVKPK